jgi:hypothetical protein
MSNRGKDLRPRKPTQRFPRGYLRFAILDAHPRRLGLGCALCKWVKVTEFGGIYCGPCLKVFAADRAKPVEPEREMLIDCARCRCELGVDDGARFCQRCSLDMVRGYYRVQPKLNFLPKVVAQPKPRKKSVQRHCADCKKPIGGYTTEHC